MMTRSIIAATLVLFGGVGAYAQTKTDVIERGDEKELKVKLEYAAGNFFLKKTEADKLCKVTSSSRDNWEPVVRYQKNGATGYLDLSVEQDESDGFNFDKQNWVVELTDKIPISFNMELGACDGNFDFSNLRVRDLNLEIGASKSIIKFDALNRDRMYNLKIDAGASKLTATGLLNANFERFEFSGGVGSYILDFSGELAQNASANISVGIGKVVVQIPKNVNAKIHVDDSFFSSCNISRDGFEKKANNVYYSTNFDDSKAVLTLYVEAGLGTVKVVSTE